MAKNLKKNYIVFCSCQNRKSSCPRIDKDVNSWTALGIEGAAQLFRRNGAAAEPRKARRLIFAQAKIKRNAQNKYQLHQPRFFKLLFQHFPADPRAERRNQQGSADNQHGHPRRCR